MLKQTMIVATVATLGVMMCGCASTGGLTEEEKKVPGLELWYENATMLVKANDPDLRADVKIGIPELDAVVNSVKDITGITPQWAESRVKELHFDGAYMEAAQQLEVPGDKKLAMKSVAFKSALFLDTVKKESAVNKRDGGEALEAALDLRTKYAREQIKPLVLCIDEESRQAFFNDPSRKQWDKETTRIAVEIAKVVKVAKTAKQSGDEAAAKAALAAKRKLFDSVGAREFDWGKVGLKLAEDTVKLQKAVTEVAMIQSQNPDLAKKIAMAKLTGQQIVAGVDGKETLAAIECFTKQLKVSIELLTWLSGNLE